MADAHVDKGKKDTRAEHTEHAKLPISPTQMHTIDTSYGILQKEPRSSRSYGLHEDLSPVMGLEPSRDIVRYKRKPDNKPLLRRPLGGLEKVYHQAMSKGMDMICLMTKLSTKFPVVPELAKQALYRLAEQHPLLRMTIQCTQDTSSQISFLEMEEMRVDFSIASGSDDWLSVLIAESAEPFDIANGPLWKCRLLLPRDKNTSLDDNRVHKPETVADKRRDGTDINMNQTTNLQSEFVHEATFLFVWHHSIMDGGYVMRIFIDFAKMLDQVHSGPNIDDHVSVSVPPPLEHILDYSSHFTRKHQTSCAITTSSVRPDDSNPSYQTLEDYNRKFAVEIAQGMHRLPRNDCIYYEFTQEETAHIMRMCRTERAPTNGIFSIACLLALIDLIYPSSHHQHYRIPFDFMLDLRKHLPLKISKGSRKYFQGVASIDIPMMADIRLRNRPVTKREFWEMSRSFGIAIQNEIHSQEPLELVRDFVQEVSSSKQQQQVGKSPYVLCLSNMGRLDGVLTGDITKRMRLTGLHGHPTVLNENSPVFFVSIFLLNGKLCGNVSFCENYTSRKTAAEYIGQFKKQILSQSKL